MKSVTYGIIEETYALGDAARTSYGIAAYAHAETDGTGAVIERIGDVTSDRERLSAFVKTCNRLDLSVIHLREAVEDFLAE